ncbi:MAG: hypothetical protein ACRCYU_05545 [Nocardioides sp.]
MQCRSSTSITAAGSVSLRHNSRLHHIGIGRTHAGTYVIPLVQDRDVRVVNAATGELLRELTIDTTRDYQPRNPKRKTPEPTLPWVRVSPMS